MVASVNPRRILFGHLFLALTLQPACADDQEQESATTKGEEEDKPSKEAGSQNENNKSDQDTNSGSEDDKPSESQGEAVPEEYRGQENPFELDDTQAVEAGKRIYEEDCEGCHGRSGEGGFPGTPDFTSAEAKSWKADWLLWKISDGSGEMMPAYKGILSTEEIWQSITFLRSLAQ